MSDPFIPQSHQGKTLDNFDWTQQSSKLKALIEKFVEDLPHKGLLLFGDPGIGKTHILCGLYRRLLHEHQLIIGPDIFYMSWAEVVNEIIETPNARFDVGIPESVADRVTASKILIIDDVRPQLGGKIGLSFLRRLIERAHERGTIWIASTNVDSLDDMIQSWGLEDYWFSRLKDLCTMVHVKGKDRRGMAN